MKHTVLKLHINCKRYSWSNFKQTIDIPSIVLHSSIGCVCSSIWWRMDFWLAEKTDPLNRHKIIICIRVVKLLTCTYYYYYCYYFIYLNSLLLLLLRHIFKRPITITITVTGEPITITITITRKFKKAYCYYYYFPDYYYYYYYYFPITIAFTITVESKKQNTIRLQSNIQRPLLLPWYYTLPQTHYHR